MRSPTKKSRPAVGIVGAARMGLALAHQIALNGSDVILLTTLEDRAKQLREDGCVPDVLPELKKMHPRVQVTTDPQDIADKTTLIFITISDYLLTKVLDLLGEHLDGAHFIVHATHSLYGEELLCSSQLIESYTCVKQIGALAGPMHMSELLEKKPNVALIGSEFAEVIERARKVLGASYFHLYGSSDIRGVEYAAALHQVVALAIGMADGLDLGSATHAAFVAAGLSEITRVGVERGAKADSFYGLVGVGRLVDALQRGEPNYSLGLELMRTKDREKTMSEASVEAKGPEVVGQLMAWSKMHGVELPFTGALAKILAGEEDAEQQLRGLLLQRELFAQMSSVPL